MATIEKRLNDDGTETFRAKVRLKGFPVQSASFDRKTDAKRWAEAMEAALREGRYFPTAEAKKRTLADLLDRYERDILPGKKNQDSQKSQLDWWRRELGHMVLKDVTPAVIGDARDRLATRIVAKAKPADEAALGASKVKGKRKPDAKAPKSAKANAKAKGAEPGPKLIAPGTINRYLAVLSHAFGVAVKEWGWLDDTPMRRVRKKPEARGRVRFLSDDERRQLLEACKTGPAWLFPVVLLAVSTGMRLGEITGLRWADVDFGKRRLILHDTKNGERRAVPLAGLALDAMREWSKVRRLDDDRVFPHTGGFHHRWWEACKRAGLEDFRFHDCRHTAASYLAMNGATLAEIAAVLGHKTLAMVKRYAHLTDSHVAGVVERMNAKMFA